MFIKYELVRQFEPRIDSKIYGLDRMLDLSLYPLARALLFWVVADSNVNNVLTVRVVGADGPDPGGGIVNLGEAQLTTANKYSKLAFGHNLAAAPFRFMGVTFDTTPAAPNTGLCWADVDIWWGE